MWTAVVKRVCLRTDTGDEQFTRSSISRIPRKDEAAILSQKIGSDLRSTWIDLGSQANITLPYRSNALHTVDCFDGILCDVS